MMIDAPPTSKHSLGLGLISMNQAAGQQVAD